MDPEPATTERVDMDSFRREIVALKAGNPDIHLPTIDPDDLTEFDAETWMMYKAKTLSIHEFNARRAEASRNLRRSDSRALFYAFIGNDWYDHYGAPTI